MPCLKKLYSFSVITKLHALHRRKIYQCVKLHQKVSYYLCYQATYIWYKFIAVSNNATSRFSIQHLPDVHLFKFSALVIPKERLCYCSNYCFLNEQSSSCSGYGYTAHCFHVPNRIFYEVFSNYPRKYLEDVFEKFISCTFHNNFPVSYQQLFIQVFIFHDLLRNLQLFFDINLEDTCYSEVLSHLLGF